MNRNMEFLNPSRKLVDEVADWLCGVGAYAGKGRVRQLREGAKTLDHVMVVVPTAQSGRNLRLAIAKRFAGGGVIPPKVIQPMRLVKPANEKWREAMPCEIAAAFQQYIKANREEVLKLDCLVRAEEFDDLTARFALLDQLEDIWRALAGRGLLMREVTELAEDKLAEEFGDEMRRWQQLGVLETGFFEYLHAHGLAYQTELIHEAKMNSAIVDDTVEEIVIPSLSDPIRVFEDVLAQQEKAGKKLTVLMHVDALEKSRFNEWGTPITEKWIGSHRPVLEKLTDDDIISVGNSSALALAVAKDFPSAKSGEALPALGLCDDGLYNGIAAAFLNKEYDVHNPEQHRLAQSSLGKLLKNLMTIYAAYENNESLRLPWNEFTTFLRSDDVLNALGLSIKSRSEVLAGLDVAQNTYVPTVIDKDVSFAEDAHMQLRERKLFKCFCTVARKVIEVLSKKRGEVSLAAFLRNMMRWIFSSRKVPSGSDGKEFQAAAEATRGFLNTLEGEFVSTLQMTAAEFAALASRELDAAVYSLEPDSADAIRTEGWLELAWSSADHIALAGFHEGKVPDSIVGHPFLPDSLRQHLGLVSNIDRLSRDSWLLQELLASHSPHAVRAYVARANDAGDICRPSRLLYLCSDASLATRVRSLFGDIPEERTDKRRLVEWKMHLPNEIAPVDHYSPSAIDTYVKCPFTYLLKYGMKMRPYKEKEELGADDFGKLMHAALEDYAKRQIAASDEGQLTDAKAIRRLFHEEICPQLRAKYRYTTLNIDLQLDAIEGRLGFFAEMQAEWAKQGWRIRMAERDVPQTLDLPELGFRLHAVIDRVDENINQDVEKPWCIIDYKTWDEKKLTSHVFTSNKNGDKNRAQLALAECLGYPCFHSGKSQTEQRVLSVQLPLYGKCLAALDNIPFAAIDYRYFILAASWDECGMLSLNDGAINASIATARRAAELIEKNIFWPIGPSNEWKFDFKGLFVGDPKSDLGDSDWVALQEKKLEACHD